MFNDDGSAVDPEEFRAVAHEQPREDEGAREGGTQRCGELLLGGDNAKTQDCLRKMFALQMKHAEEDEQSKMSSPDLLRNRVHRPERPRGALPADAQSRAAVRTRVWLLSQVWIPQATADEQRKAALGNVSDATTTTTTATKARTRPSRETSEKRPLRCFVFTHDPTPF